MNMVVENVNSVASRGRAIRPRPRNWLRVIAFLMAVSVGFPWTLAAPQPTLAAPNYKHPLFCGREFRGNSRGGHGWGLDVVSTSSGNTRGQEVMASAGGTVSEHVGWNGQLRINHGGGFYTVYAHMDPVVVEYGDTILAGQLLGFVSDKGDADGNHLHYGQDLGPYPWDPQQVRFNGTLYNYAYGSSAYGSDIDSTHCLTPPATDILDEDTVPTSFLTAIGWLYQQGITSGCGSLFDNPAQSARFCPEAILTRAEMATFLDRYLTLSDTSTDYFTDDEGSPHEQAINNIAAAGITSGCGGTHYCPDSQVTREQMATFLNRPLNIANTSTDYFTDDETSPHEQAINNLRSVNISSGCTTTTFCPTGLVNRMQMAAFLYNGRNYR